MRFILRLLQLLIGVLLLTTALGKLLDNRGFAEVLLTYDLYPAATLLPLALALSLVELFLALWILSGIGLKYSAGVAVLLHAQFTLVAIISNVRGLDIPNCGCFGVFWARPMTWFTVLEDAVLTLACLTLFLLAKRLPDLVRVRLARSETVP